MGTCKFGVTRFAVPHLLTLYSFEFPRYFEGNPSGAHTFFFFAHILFFAHMWLGEKVYEFR